MRKAVKYPSRLLDAAAYMLANHGRMESMKLQCLCYYAQAWHATRWGFPMFAERVEAWANAPTFPVLRAALGPTWRNPNPERLPQGARGRAWLPNAAKGTVDEVLSCYGLLSGYQIAVLTHQEDPWKRARGDLPIGAPGKGRVIPVRSMVDYYRTL